MVDAGKSTVKGAVNYAEGSKDSVMTDADTVVEIAGILGENKAKMNPDKLAKCLNERGYEVEATTVNGKKAIRFKNGDVFVDSNGDGGLHLKEMDYMNALTKVEQRFNVNLSGVKYSAEAAVDLRAAQKRAKKLDQ